MAFVNIQQAQQKIKSKYEQSSREATMLGFHSKNETLKEIVTQTAR